MYKFNYEEYAESENQTLRSLDVAREVADEISKAGFSNLFFTAVGGSLSPMMAIGEMAKQMTEVPVYVEQAAELAVHGNRKLNRDSVVITMSKSGDTKETVAIAEKCHEMGCRVIAIAKDADSPLGKAADWYIPMKHTNGVEYEYMILYALFFGILYRKGDFEQYLNFFEQLKLIPKGLLKVKEQFEEKADQIAAAYYQEPYMLWIGSGETWGETYLFSMCILEEMQWIRTKSVTSPEFFHGTLELVTDDTCVFLIKGEGKCRILDERTEKFLNTHTKKLTVIDTKEYVLEGIDDEFRPVIAPMIASTILVDRLAVYMEKYTGHDLDMRRYYRQFDY